MSKPKRQIIVLLLLAMGMAAGCQPSGPTSTPTLPGESLEWARVHYEPMSPHRETTPMLRVATTPEQAAEIEDFLQLPYHLRPVSDTNFVAHFVIAVFQGKKMSTGYSIIVRDVRKDGNTITVHTSFRSPGPDSVVGAAETSPYYVLEVKKTPELKGDFTFVLVANDQELMRQTHSIP